MAPERPPFTPEQHERYRRHLSLPEFGVEGQQALLRGRVLLVGAGGLGCPAAQYLAAAGVGTLGVLDFDRVELSNLQRQVLYTAADVGRPKVDVAAERVTAQNPDVRVERHAVRLTAGNALEILASYDLVLDGSDNFPTRYLVNDACAMLGKPNVHGSILRFEGQVTLFDARRGPCYRCLFPEPPDPGSVPSCAEAGVLGVLPGLVALVQATEALKCLTGIGEGLIGRLLQIDARRMEFLEFRLKKDPGCPVCGPRPTITELVDYDGFCGIPQLGRATPGEVTAAQLAARLRTGEELVLLDVREPVERATASIEGSHHVALRTLEARLPELEAWKGRSLVVYCHHGARSAKACEILLSRGFDRVENLIGGIDAWSLTVDAHTPRY